MKKKGGFADKEALHEEIRNAVEANGGKRVAILDFQKSTGRSANSIYQHYSKWEDALSGAGFNFRRYHDRVPQEVLLEKWGIVARKLGRPPASAEFTANSTGSTASMGRRFGSWGAIPAAFRRYAQDRKEWADVVAIIKSCPRRRLWAKRRRISRTMRKPSRNPIVRQARKILDRPEYGGQLDFPAMRHAPSNEQGVVYLFGILAERMGFSVERMQSIYPDCIAKKRNSSGKWQNVVIEFEYESRNFRIHGHDPDSCDIIVCWEHNWPECPKNIEVIALSEETRRLTPECRRA